MNDEGSEDLLMERFAHLVSYGSVLLVGVKMVAKTRARKKVTRRRW